MVVHICIYVICLTWVRIMTDRSTGCQTDPDHILVMYFVYLWYIVCTIVVIFVSKSICCCEINFYYNMRIHIVSMLYTLYTIAYSA